MRVQQCTVLAPLAPLGNSPRSRAPLPLAPLGDSPRKRGEKIGV